jgi:hypothetical protein
MEYKGMQEMGLNLKKLGMVIAWMIDNGCVWYS